MKTDQKSVIRAHCSEIRESLSPEHVARTSAAICQLLAAWPVLTAAKTVLTYLAFNNELDLSALFTMLPTIAWVVPRIDGRALRLHRYDSEHLIRHRFGTLEPAPQLPSVQPDDLDVVLVPGMAFDVQGRRLGLGGGFYDRFLPTTRAVRVGIAHDQCTPDQIPTANHDEHVDWLATPTRIIRCHALK